MTSPIAQWLERLTGILKVMGSTPVGGSENPFSEYFDLRMLLHCLDVKLLLISFRTKPRPEQSHLANPPGGEVLDLSLGVEVRPGPSYPDPTLFKTEFRFLIPCLRHLTRNHVLCKTIICKYRNSSFSNDPLVITKLLQPDQQSREELFTLNT